MLTVTQVSLGVSLNWTKIGLKPAVGFCGSPRCMSLNWTKIGLKPKICVPSAPENWMFELD